MDDCVFLLHIIMLPFLLCTAVVIYREDREEMSTTITTLHSAEHVQYSHYYEIFARANEILREQTHEHATRAHDQGSLISNLLLFCFKNATTHHGRRLQHGSLCHPPTHMGYLSCGIFLAIIFATICIIIITGQETLLAPLPSDARIGNGK